MHTQTHSLTSHTHYIYHIIIYLTHRHEHIGQVMTRVKTELKDFEQGNDLAKLLKNKDNASVADMVSVLLCVYVCLGMCAYVCA